MFKLKDVFFRGKIIYVNLLNKIKLNLFNFDLLSDISIKKVVSLRHYERFKRL